ncbi:response regulator transcription factor [Clostridium sp. LP20]|uniref:response regulator transcription factor n=1 Tax=Clostridium sp. LP20 TaxID=3418665 RepID=UPI003EE7789F
MDRVLIIEDEERVAEVLKAYLEKEGYEVYCATKGLKGIEIFKSMEIKLIILDLMLPDIRGEEICKVIRETSDTHIFMLTAKGSLEDRIDGFNIGADEYLVKPFSPRELTARVNALFRRLDTSNNTLNNTSDLLFNDRRLSVDYDKRTVKINDKEVSFTPNEFDILYQLILNKGKVLSREQLISKVFGMDFEGYDRTVDVHIKNIRKKIEEDRKNPKYIITVMKVGYKFGGEN